MKPSGFEKNEERRNETMSFIKGMAVGLVTGAVTGIVLMPKPKRRCMHMRKSADKAARSIGELVDSIISVIV